MDNQFQNGFPQNQQNNMGYQPNQYPNQQMPPQNNMNMPPVGQYQYAPVMQQPPKKKSKVGPIILVVAVLLIVVAAASIFGKSAPEKKFYGEWTATVDLTEYLKEEMSDSAKELVGDDFKYEFTYEFEFKDDNTFVLKLDKDSFEKTMNSYKATLKEGMLNQLRETYPGYTDEEYEEYYEYTNGISMDDKLDESFADFTYEDYKEDIDSEGKFKVEDNKIFFSESLDYEVDEKVYYNFEEKSDSEILIKAVDFIEKDKEIDITLVKE